MLLKPDQERVKVLLKDTLTLLCKNGLEFDAKFRIEALIGITLDDKNVFLLNFDEIIKSANDDSVESGSSKETGVSPRRIRKRRRTSTADSDRSQSAGDKKSTSKLSVSASQTQHRQNENDDEVVVVKDEADDWDESIQEVEQLDFTSFDSTSLPSTSHHGNPLELSDVRLEEATDQERASAWLVHHTAGARSSVAQQLNTSAFGDVSQQGPVSDAGTCHMCEKSFTSRGNFQRHMKMHAGIYPYSCSTCQKGFTSKQRLVAHQLGHTGELPHKCQHCSESFSRMGVLIDHVTQTHGLPWRGPMTFP